MARYTVELRELVQSGFPLGMESYPIFDEDYRPMLNQKIIEHYAFREIGFETAALFRNRLNEKLSMIMPYYNMLYKSAMLELDPLTTINISDTTDVKRGSTTDSSTSQNTTQKNIQDTTQDQKQDTTQSTVEKVQLNALDKESTKNTLSGTQKVTGATDSTSQSTDTIKDTTTGTKTADETGTNKEDSTDTKNQKQVNSDTPQGLLSMGDIETDVYATTATIAAEDDIHSGNQNHTIERSESTSTEYDRTATTGGNIHGTNEADTVTSTITDITGEIIKDDTTNTTGELSAGVKSTSTENTTANLTGNLSGNSTTNDSGWETITKLLKGYQSANPSDLIIKFRQTFLNIDALVIAELETLFMCIY